MLIINPYCTFNSHPAPPCLSAALAQAVSEGNPEEEDLFVVRAVLQLLAVGKGNGLDEKLEDAQELLQSYESMMRRGLPDTPLMHFVNLLIKVGRPSQRKPPLQALCVTWKLQLDCSSPVLLHDQALPSTNSYM